MGEPATSLRVLNEEIVACRKCARLVKYREEVARVKRRMFREWEYWGKAVPGFGDPRAQLFILGLAPAAHGANRTGRVFTGDRSGDFLYAALHQAGWAHAGVTTATILFRRDGCPALDGLTDVQPLDRRTADQDRDAFQRLVEAVFVVRDAQRGRPEVEVLAARRVEPAPARAQYAEEMPTGEPQDVSGHRPLKGDSTWSLNFIMPPSAAP